MNTTTSPTVPTKTLPPPRQRLRTMEARASIPVSLPVQNPLPSPWQEPPIDIADHGARAPLPASADVVIIGSGITGSTAAFELLEADRSLNVVLIDARACASGATGRNGGHTKHASYRAFLDNQRELGKDEASKIVKFEYECFMAVHAFARKHKISCESWEGDTVDVVCDETQWEHTKQAISALKEAVGEDHPSARYSLWSPEETEARFLTPGACGSVTYAAGSINAYAFTCGVLKLGLDRGLQLYTHTPATKLTQDNDAWNITTARGVIRAQKLLLATNGYTAYLMPELQGVVVPLRGQITVHRRGPSMPPPSPPTTYSFIHKDSYDYAIQRSASSAHPGDIVIGGGLSSGVKGGLFEYGCIDDSSVDEGIMHYLDVSTQRFFGENWGNDRLRERIRSRHTGIMGYSPDGLPLVGQMKKNLWISVAFNGHGMVTALFAARAVTSMIRGYDDDKLQSWFPNSLRYRSERTKVKFSGRGHVVFAANEHA